MTVSGASNPVVLRQAFKNNGGWFLLCCLAGSLAVLGLILYLHSDLVSPQSEEAKPIEGSLVKSDPAKPDPANIALIGALIALWHIVLGISMWAAATLLKSVWSTWVGRIPEQKKSNGFRWKSWLTQEDWIIFSLTIWATVTGSLGLVMSKSDALDGTDMNTWAGRSIVAVLGGIVAAFCITNLLRFIQYWQFVTNGLQPPPHLCCGSTELTPEMVNAEIEKASNSIVGKINGQLQDVEILLARDGQAGVEILWSEQYIERLTKPNLSFPADVLSIDSQTSLRAIYPAALLFWSEQIRHRLQAPTTGLTFRNQGAREKGMLWRQRFAEFITDRIRAAHRNFAEINAAFARPVPREDDINELIDYISPERPFAARILIYDFGVLPNEVVRAVIEFHHVVNIPLFFLPASYCRELGSEAAEGKNEQVNELVNLYEELQDTGGGRWTKNAGKGIDFKYLWTGSNDDFIIVDDGAWVGYPVSDRGRSQPPEEVNPLPLISKFCLLLDAPRLLLASEARALAAREGGPSALANWYHNSNPQVSRGLPLASMSTQGVLNENVFKAGEYPKPEPTTSLQALAIDSQNLISANSGEPTNMVRVDAEIGENLSARE